MAAPEVIGGRALQAAWESGAEDPTYDWNDLTESEQAYWIAWMAEALGAIRVAGWELFRPEDAEPAWLGETNTDEVQNLVYDRHAHVIDVSRMDSVWIIDRLVPMEGEK